MNRRHALECMIWAGTGALWGEHAIIDEDRGKAYLERHGKGSKGAGWYSFDDHGVHFVGLVNVVDLQEAERAIWAPNNSPGLRQI